MIQTQDIIKIVEGKTLKIVEGKTLKILEMIEEDHLRLLQVAQVDLHLLQDLNQANQNDIYLF